MSDPPDLESLVNLAVGGDMPALMSLLEACAPKVRARIDSRINPHLRSSLDVDDVMQVTYVEAVMRIGRFKTGGASGFHAWLTRLAENNLIDAVRSLEAARRPDPSRRVSAAPRTGHESMVALVDMLSGTMTTPSRHAARGEAAAHLDAALKSLPPDYEKVVRMYDLEGKPIDEVAKTIGRSEGAVFMLRSRAHDRLREAMGPSGNFFSKQA
ncbi:ECF RNA polymerase sigma factor SigE [Phycisphaerales bacterium]|nr:ECF RNA polymerase sigma factor SigE [Phycisphaerales bacterium]